MIGTVVEIPPRTTFWIWFFLLLIPCLLVLAASPAPWHAMAALIPACMALGAFLAREPGMQFRVESDHLAFESPSHSNIYFADLRAVRRGRNDQCHSLYLYEKGDVHRIPLREDIGLYDFLTAAMPGRLEAVVPRALEGYFEEQVAKFGRERVHVYQSYALGPAPKTPTAGYAIWLGFACGSGIAIAFIQAAAPQDIRNWNGLVVMVILFSMIGLFATYATRSNARNAPANRHGGSMLIITPVGLALQQDDLTGKLRWDEILSIDQPPRHRSFQASTATSRHGIGLQVAGAYIVIKDILDDDILSIARLMRSHWRE